MMYIRILHSLPQTFLNSTFQLNMNVKVGMTEYRLLIVTRSILLSDATQLLASDIQPPTSISLKSQFFFKCVPLYRVYPLIFNILKLKLEILVVQVGYNYILN